MFNVTDPQSRPYARLAGLLYLIIAVAGGFSIAYVPSQLYIPNDLVASVTALLGNRTMFLAGIAGDIIMMTAEILLTAMLYFMFRHVSGAVSMAAALARFAMVGVMAAMLFFYAGMVVLAGPDSAIAEISNDTKLGLAAVFLAMHDAGIWIWQLFFALHLALLGWLVSRSGMFPKIFGCALAVGGLGYLLDSVYAFAFPELAWLGMTRAVLLGIVTLAEIGFALFLLIRGPKRA